MKRMLALGFVVLFGCSHDSTVGPTAGGAELVVGPPSGSGGSQALIAAAVNRPPVVEITGVGIYRDGQIDPLKRPFRMRVKEHALITIRFVDPDGDWTEEITRMTGVPGLYYMGFPLLDGDGALWQFDAMEPHRAGLARITATVTDSQGATAQASITIHVQGLKPRAPVPPTVPD